MEIDTSGTVIEQQMRRIEAEIREKNANADKAGRDKWLIVIAIGTFINAILATYGTFFHK